MAITKTHLDKLDATMREKALVAFHTLASEQRGEPEQMGAGGTSNANPAIHNATGIWTWLSEHVGDITNRIANRRHVEMHYGIDMAGPKVDTALRLLRHRYGVAKEIGENLRAAYRYAQEKGQDVPDFETWERDFKAAGARYAAAHAKLPVFNKAQALARAAAICVGRFDYTMCELNLSRLVDMMDGSDWPLEAGTVYVDGDRIVSYDEAKAASLAETLVLGVKRDPNSPAQKMLDEYNEETQDHPMLPHGTRLLVYSPNEFVMLKLSRDIDDPNHSVHLSDINTSARSGGFGSKALTWLCALADKHNVTITGLAKAYTRARDKSALSQKDLIAWYARHGFSVKRGRASDGQEMSRPPKLDK